MGCFKSWLSATALFLVSGSWVMAPAAAEVAFKWAEIRSVSNQVELISATGHRQPVVVTDCLCPGYTLSTQGMAQAELQFNDGSLARVGEQAQLQFWPTTRTLRLTQGTTLLFVPPEQGRTSIETPNALTGLQDTAVVVRYVPDRNLTLVMSLSTPSTGPVSVMGNAYGQEASIYAGQMALVSDTGLQVIDFDLLEFYRTSRLVRGLNLSNPTHGSLEDDPIALLRPNLLSAIAQQQPFPQTTSILDPVLINNPIPSSTLFQFNPEILESINNTNPIGEAQRPAALPPGVVMPLPEMAPPAETPENQLPENPIQLGVDPPIDPVTPSRPGAPEPEQPSPVPTPPT
jgi:hypothetical protein